MDYNKPIHVKPSFYAHCFERLKVVAMVFGYNLVLHGSMARDLDLIAIPWSTPLGNVDDMIKEFADAVGGQVLQQSGEERACFPHGRTSYVINIDRGGKHTEFKDAQYYLDISVMPAV